MNLITLFGFLCIAHTSYAYIRVCYYAAYAAGRDPPAKLEPKDIDPFLCTHIVYAFASVNSSTLLLDNRVENKQLPHEKLYKQLKSLKKKNPDLKILLSVGGAAHEKYTSPFHEMTKTDKRIDKFVKKAIPFLRKRGFDGLDVDWEYPEHRPESMIAELKDDRFRHALLIKKLRAAFDAEDLEGGKKEKLLLTLAMPKSADKLDTGYVIDDLAANVDYMTIMAYAMTAAGRKKAGHHSPLTWYKYNVEKAVKLYLDSNVPTDKIILGISTYGRAYRLQDGNNNKLEAPTDTDTPMVRGKYTKLKATFAKYEMCDMKWTKTVTKNKAQAPYSYNVEDKIWVGFDNKESIRLKIKELVKGKNLGGVGVWTIGLDDFSGKFCGKRDGSEKFPLINAMKDALEQ